MSERIKDRWYRWDVMMNEGNAVEVIKECDAMIRNKQSIVLGDMVRRSQALEMIGVLIFKKDISIKKRVNNA
jgi:hypothetical protein